MPAQSNSFVDIGLVHFTPTQRQLWRAKKLSPMWYEQYPQLFDQRDFDQTLTQPHYHFFEWLAAIIIHTSTGYLSLVEHYENKIHNLKQAILQETISDELFQVITQNRKAEGPQCPDLFMYLPDKSDWFFCEVKGPGDRLRKSQREYFERLSNISGTPIRLLKLHELKT